VAMLDVHFRKVNSKQIGLFQTNRGWIFGQNFHIVAKEKEKEIKCEYYKRLFCGKKREKSRHFLMKNCHMLPYLDNEFLEVARTSQDS
jgi:hypothetical protein